MALWLILFILVILISLLLAYLSMKDYREIPSLKKDFSLFLIRKTKTLDKDNLNLLLGEFVKSNLNISFERLIRGSESALVVCGPFELLNKFKDSFDLLELEDYTNVLASDISSWEVGIKNNGNFPSFPHLSDSEQIWWQVILTPTLKANIRAVVVSKDSLRREKIADEFLKDLKSKSFFRIPKSFSNAQILDFYKNRSLSESKSNPTLTLDSVLSLIKL